MKKNLKKIRLLAILNESIKSFITKHRYKKITSYYEKKDLKYIPRCTKDVKKVFYLGTDEHQDKSGFLQALTDIFEVRYFVRANGEYGQYKRSTSSKEKNSKQLEILFEKNAREGFVPDMLLMQTWAWSINVALLNKIKEKYNCIVVNIGMDDRHSYTDHGNWSEGTYGLIPVLDLALTSAPECVQWYKKEGVDALFFPEASHPDFFYPIPEVEKIYDVGFIGAKYGIREKIVNALRKEGINVQCYGNGWESGRLPLDKTNLFFNQCKIILGVGTIGHCSDFYALKLRDFDAPMSGAIYLTHNNIDLHPLFHIGKEMFLAENIDEFIRIAKKILSTNESQLADYRKQAREKSLSAHKYTDRLKKLKGYLSK